MIKDLQVLKELQEEWAGVRRNQALVTIAQAAAISPLPPSFKQKYHNLVLIFAYGVL